jgi:uncharacterized protein (DUF58 family)
MNQRRNTLYLLIIGALLMGLFTGRAIFFTLSYLLGSLLIIALVWSFFSVRGVRIQRYTPSRRGQVGRVFGEQFTLRNRGISPKVWLEVYDESTLPFHRSSHVVPPLLMGRQYGWRVETNCLVRGVFRLGPMMIRSGDPFGLYEMQRRIPAQAEIIVYPRTYEIERFQLPMGVLSGGDAQRRWTQQVTTNAAGVRDYVPGDTINRIHWKSTARRRKLIAKEFELDPQVDIWLFVDFSAQSLVESPTVKRTENGNVIPERTEAIPASTEEYGVVAGASLARHFIQQGRSLGFTAYIPQREMLPPERGDQQLTEILESLAVARSQSMRPLHEMLMLETQTFTRGTSLIIVTASLDINWVTQAQILSRRGIRPTCVFINPETFGGQSANHIKEALVVAKIPYHIIERHDAIGDKLSQYPII